MQLISNRKGNRSCRVSRHAVERYRQRVDDFGTYRDIEAELRLIYEHGEVVRTMKDPTLDKNTTKVFYKYFGTTILVYEEKHEDVIISCFGDERLQKWYSKENRKRRLRFSRI